MKFTKALAVATMSAFVSLAPAAPAAAAEPQPQCEFNGNETPCWEYYDWYWTYSNCHAAGQAEVNKARYSDYLCDGGATVYLWLKRA